MANQNVQNGELIEQTYAGKIENLLSLLDEVKLAYQRGDDHFINNEGEKINFSRFLKVGFYDRDSNDVVQKAKALQQRLTDRLREIGRILPKIYDETISLTGLLRSQKYEYSKLELKTTLTQEEKNERKALINDRYFNYLKKCRDHINDYKLALRRVLVNINRIAKYNLMEPVIFDENKDLVEPGRAAMTLASQYVYLGEVLTNVMDKAHNLNKTPKYGIGTERYDLDMLISNEFKEVVDEYRNLCEEDDLLKEGLEYFLGNPRHQTPEIMDLHVVKSLPPALDMKSYVTKLDFLEDKTGKFVSDDVVLSYRIYPNTPDEEIPNADQAYILKSEWDKLIVDKMPLFEGKIIFEAPKPGINGPWPCTGAVVTALGIENYPWYDLNQIKAMPEKDKMEIFDKVVNVDGIGLSRLTQYFQMRINKAKTQDVKSLFENEKRLASTVVTNKDKIK